MEQLRKLCTPTKDELSAVIADFIKQARLAHCCHLLSDAHMG